MNKEPKCPCCGKPNPPLCIVRYHLRNYPNPNDGAEHKVETDMLCCDKCGAILGQYDDRLKIDTVI
jgi:hypothetical protein